MIRRTFHAPAALLAGLPLAFLAIAIPPNTYEAALGIEALDCDGPIKVYLVAAPTLILYGLAFAVTVRRWRRPGNAVLALACLVVCALVARKLLDAVAIERDQDAACRAL